MVSDGNSKNMPCERGRTNTHNTSTVSKEAEASVHVRTRYPILADTIVLGDKEDRQSCCNTARSSGTGLQTRETRDPCARASTPCCVT